MSAVTAAGGTVSQMEVNGSVNIKNFLVGSPQIKIMLNEDLVVLQSKEKDICLEWRVEWSVSGEMCLNQPFSLRSFVGDADGSRDVRVTLRLRSNFPSSIIAVNVKVRFSIPKSVSSISSKLSSDEQKAAVSNADRQFVWTLKRVPGKTECIAEFRLINQGSGRLSQQEIDPIVLEFEISGYTCSGITINGLKIPGADKGLPRKQFVRLITANDSFMCLEHSDHKKVMDKYTFKTVLNLLCKKIRLNYERCLYVARRGQ